MTAFLWVAGAVAVAVAALFFLRRDSRKRGEAEAVNKAQSEVLDDVEKANDARDRLRADPDYAEKVRNRFTRD